MMHLIGQISCLILLIFRVFGDSVESYGCPSPEFENDPHLELATRLSPDSRLVKGKTVFFFKENTVAFFKCDNATTSPLNDELKLTCVKKRDSSFDWEGEVPKCVDNICLWDGYSDVTFMFHDRVLNYSSQKRFPRGARLKYRSWPNCTRGAQLLAEERICLVNKTWSGSQPRCIPADEYSETLLIWALTLTCLFIIAILVISCLLLHIFKPHPNALNVREFARMSSRYLFTNSARYLPTRPRIGSCESKAKINDQDDIYETVDETIRIEHCNRKEPEDTNKDETPSKAKKEFSPYANVIPKNK